MTSTYLLSIDLEDVRLRMHDGHNYSPRVVEATGKYMKLFEKYNLQLTFFVVGDLARQNPDLLRAILDSGHEIACHTDTHIPLSEQTEDSFRRDLEKNLESLYRCGANSVKGFRAPVFSLTEKTSWTYQVLEDLGFTYSSSVLPSPNPLNGWPGFGASPRKIGNILEIPVTLLPLPRVSIPFAGGVYFRALPELFITAAFKKFLRENRDVVGYFHPYDLDTEQERFMHPGINNSKFYNFLMYYNRKSVVPRLEKIINQGWNVCRYDDYVSALENCPKKIEAHTLEQFQVIAAN